MLEDLKQKFINDSDVDISFYKNYKKILANIVPSKQIRDKMGFDGEFNEF